MNLQTEKYRLIQQIVNLQDEKIIGEIKKFLNSQVDSDWYTELSPSQKDSIEKGIQDFSNGNTFTHNEVTSLIEDKVKELRLR
ncbi:hypothetical protein NBT05_02285 [Aquimarina sp. ERC-38]|uniref:hypothetical protein n=1 Tax=Aquimarina sp. ERC-38 TaxID=2949996 RepID=UPI002246216A|nr:hypothetical protein [Aquimarina sp. ERC-38]UZO81313.1 hypothetical protein NBT05_02285 [Aquimarina sp. ERC-38]